MSTDEEAIRLCIRDVANGDDPEKVADYLIAAFFAPARAEAALAGGTSPELQVNARSDLDLKLGTSPDPTERICGQKVDGHPCALDADHPGPHRCPIGP